MSLAVRRGTRSRGPSRTADPRPNPRPHDGGSPPLKSMRHGALQEQPKEQRTSRCRLTRGACAGAVGLRETSEIVVSLHEKKGVFTPFVMQPLPSRQRPSATSELGHWDIDFADGTLVWSEQARRLFGVDPTAPPSIEQLLSRVHPEDRSRVEEQYVRSSRSDPVYYIEFRIVTRDGAVRWLEDLGRVERMPQGSRSEPSASSGILRHPRVPRRRSPVLLPL
jgi:PAS domain-containing protein